MNQRREIGATVRLLALAVILMVPAMNMGAEEKQKKEDLLCRGYYQSEEAAKEQLERIKQTYSNLEEWKQRAAMIREGILRGAELLPPPEKCELNPIFRGRREYDGYTVENVAFESLPGFFVAGNLYRPRPMRGKQQHAAILCPHGHFRNYNGGGRFRDDMQKRCASPGADGSDCLCV